MRQNNKMRSRSTKKEDEKSEKEGDAEGIGPRMKVTYI